MQSLERNAVVGLVVISSLVAGAATRKQYRFTVSPGASISVDTRYGAIAIKAGSGNQAIVVAQPQSEKVEVDTHQMGNRISVDTHLLPGADAQSGRVDYEVTVPQGVTISVRSSNGPLTAEGIQGDLEFEGAEAPIDVRHVSHGHVHVKTMNGLVTLTDVHDAHIEITSIGGDVQLTSVTGPLVEVNSGSGKVSYDGDFGSGGEYRLITHTGDIMALVPATASADFQAHSVRGQVQNDFPLAQMPHPQTKIEAGRAFIGTVGKAASKVVLRSFSGRIRLKQR
jgi:putative adhesin